jgi:3-oxoacyl-(acyl-carrier-protein) synthase
VEGLLMSCDVTGIGAIACVGGDPYKIFDALCAGQSGLAPLRAFDSGKYRARRAFEIDDRAVPGEDEPRRATRWLCAAMRQALVDAGLENASGSFPVLVGSMQRELRSAELWWTDAVPFGLADLHFTTALGAEFGTTHSDTISSACAASLCALAMATDLIELGWADTVVVAGTDSITESAFGGMDRLQHPTPEDVRPFDKARRGMLMGEGAAAVVLRRSDTHQGPTHARVRGVSMNCDGLHPTAPDAPSIAGAIREAHHRAGVYAEDIDLVIAHGSGTQQNDVAEALALAEVFAQVAPPPLVTAIKAATGHTSGGSGLLSLVMACLALQHGAVPPIHGLTDPIEEAADLRLVRTRPVTATMTTAQINAFGMGGINAVAVVDKAMR